MRDPLFGADERNYFSHWIARHAEPLLHECAHSVAVRYVTHPEPVPAELRLQHRFGHACQRCLGGCEVRITGTEIDHIHAAREQLALSLRDAREWIFGQCGKPARERRH